jgi:antitoxin (DNA-binding transcriptional repressor) of toxin-antitoxin stability system
MWQARSQDATGPRFDNLTAFRHNPTMKTVNIGQLKSRLSHHLRQVRAGETVTILDRDKPIARIVPIGAGGDIVITKPARSAPSFASISFPKLPKIKVDVVKMLLEDRRRR